jgi:hypothetical protein
VSEGNLRTLPNGSQVLVDDPYETLSGQCAAAGLTQRQREVVLSVARGRSNAEISAALRISEVGVDQVLSAAVGKLEERFGEVRGLPGSEARDLLDCMFKRSCSNPPVAVYDQRGRQVGVKAKAFGMLPEDIARRRPRGSQVLLELVCRLQGSGVPVVRRRMNEIEARRHTERCLCAKCRARKGREVVAECKNRRQRRALKFGRKA